MLQRNVMAQLVPFIGLVFVSCISTNAGVWGAVNGEPIVCSTLHLKLAQDMQSGTQSPSGTALSAVDHANTLDTSAGSGTSSGSTNISSTDGSVNPVSAQSPTYDTLSSARSGRWARRYRNTLLLARKRRNHRWGTPSGGFKAKTKYRYPYDALFPVQSFQVNPAKASTLPTNVVLPKHKVKRHETVGSYYGTRTSVFEGRSTSATEGTSASASALRFFESLVIVIGLTAALLWIGKKTGYLNRYVGPSNKQSLPKRSWLADRMRSSQSLSVASPLLTVRSSITLPGAPGSMLHVVEVGDRTFLLGATPQSIHVIGDWDGTDVAFSPARTEDAFTAIMAKENAKAENGTLSAAAEKIAATRERIARMSEKFD